MRGLAGGSAARASLAEFLVSSGEGRLLVVGAVPAHVGPHEVEEMAGAVHPPAFAHLAELEPRVQRHAETLDGSLAGRLGCCHTEKLTAMACVVTVASASVVT
jgi:hypothetical protein